jgi:hypothetical protein
MLISGEVALTVVLLAASGFERSRDRKQFVDHNLESEVVEVAVYDKSPMLSSRRGISGNVVCPVITHRVIERMEWIPLGFPPAKVRGSGHGNAGISIPFPVVKLLPQFAFQQLSS